MTAADYAQVLGSAAVSALVAGLLAAVILRLARRAPLVIHVLVIVGAAVGAVAGGIALTARGMYINDADTAVALAVIAASGVVSLAMALLLATALSRDARRLGRDARRLGAGDPVEPARRVTAELDSVQGELAESSDRLTAARADSERAEAARRDLVARIAHDLLAPLASIRAIAETLEDGLSPEPERHARQLGSHVTRLHALIGDLFELSRIDAGTLALTPETVSLTDLASDVVADYATLAAQHDVGLEFLASEAVTAHVDARALSRAIVNVLVNALEHSPAGAVVTVTVDTHDGDGRVRVRDRGPGIAADDLAHVFEAGWRASAARTAPRVGLAGGAGLGLAITRAILEAHGGSARVARVDPGAEFSLLLPRR
jgi:signal transduction histidine kinase